MGRSDVEDGDDIRESVSELDFVMSSYGDGIYTLECRSHKNAARGSDTHTFVSGDVKQDSGRNANTTATAAPSVQVGAFYGGLDAKYFMEKNEALAKEVQRLEREVFKREMEMINLRRDLKDTEKVSGPSIGSFLEKNPTLVSEMIGILGGAAKPAPRANVGVLKSHQPIPSTPPPVAEIEGDNNETEEDAESEAYEYEDGKLDINALVDAAYRIRTALPGFHPNEVFDMIADFAEDKPDQAVQLINML